MPGLGFWACHFCSSRRCSSSRLVCSFLASASSRCCLARRSFLALLSPRSLARFLFFFEPFGFFLETLSPSLENFEADPIVGFPAFLDGFGLASLEAGSGGGRGGGMLLIAD